MSDHPSDSPIRRFTTIIALALIVCAWPGRQASAELSATEGAADTLNLTQILELAFRDNLSLRSSRRDLEIAESSRARAHNERHLPSLDLSWDVQSRNSPLTVFDTTGTRHLVEEESVSTDGRLSLEQPLPLDAKLSLSGSALQRLRSQGATDLPAESDGELAAVVSLPLFDRSGSLRDADQRSAWELERAQLAHQSEQADLRLRIIRAYYDLLRAEGLLALQARSYAQSQSQATRAGEKLRAGLLAEGDLLQLEVARDLSEASLFSGRGSVERAREELNDAMGRAPEFPLTISSHVPPPPRLRIDPDSLLVPALARRAEIRRARLGTAGARLSAASTRSSQGINASLEAGLGLRGSGEDLGAAFDDLTQDRSASLNLNWTLWDFGRGRRLVDEARAEVERSRIAEEEAGRQLVLELREQVRAYERALARARVLERAALAARRSHEIAIQRFEAGNIDSQRLLQEQAAALEAGSDHLSAVIDVHLAVAALERAILGPLVSEIPAD